MSDIYPSRFSLNDLYRMQYVKRWHILHGRKTQTIAEHSFAVAMISAKIIDHLDEEKLLPEWFDDKFRYDTVIWALNHDVAEIVMGDMVGPMKKIVNGGANKMEAIIDPDLKKWEIGLHPICKEICKMADLLDATKYLQEECLHNHHGRSTYVSANKWIESQKVKLTDLIAEWSTDKRDAGEVFWTKSLLETALNAIIMDLREGPLLLIQDVNLDEEKLDPRNVENIKI